MPISVDSFQKALYAGSINTDSYIRLSKDKSGVESYTANALGRHFHLHASREDNREVRRAFYESITSKYQCNDAVCASLRKELGIDSGNHSALSVRDAMNILQRVKIAAHNIDNQKVQDKKSFNTHGNATFQTEILNFFTKSSLSIANNDQELPTIAKAFEQGLQDYNRSGFGLKLGTEIVAYVNQAYNSGTPERTASDQEMTAKIERFFNADPKNGLKAARIIGAFAHQGGNREVIDSIRVAKDPVDIGNCLSITPGARLENFSIDRASDGSYKIHYMGIFSPERGDHADGTNTLYNCSDSSLRYEMDFVLSFDTSGKANIAFEQPPTLSGKFSPTSNHYPLSLSTLFGCKDPEDNTFFVQSAQLTGQIDDPAIQKAIVDNDIDFLRSQLITDSDRKVLSDVLHIDLQIINLLITGSAADVGTPRLDKETITQLLDPTERSKALNKLQTMLQPLFDLDMIAPFQAPDLRPELLNLVTVAGLNHGSGDPCDAKLVADYMRTSNDPDHQRILNDLGSSDPTKVAAAKNDVKAILAMLRNPSAPAPTAADVQQPINQTTTTTTTTTTTITEGSDSEQPSTPAPPPPVMPQLDINQTTTTTTITEGSEPEQPTPAPQPPITPQPNIQPTTDAKPEQPPTASAPPPPTVEP